MLDKETINYIEFVWPSGTGELVRQEIIPLEEFCPKVIRQIDNVAIAYKDHPTLRVDDLKRVRLDFVERPDEVIEYIKGLLAVRAKHMKE